MHVLSLYALLQEQKLIDESSNLDSKLTELIHRTENGARPSSEIQPIKEALDRLLAEAHTSKVELLDHYSSEKNSLKQTSNADSGHQVESATMSDLEREDSRRDQSVQETTRPVRFLRTQ